MIEKGMKGATRPNSNNWNKNKNKNNRNYNKNKSQSLRNKSQSKIRCGNKTKHRSWIYQHISLGESNIDRSLKYSHNPSPALIDSIQEVDSRNKSQQAMLSLNNRSPCPSR